MDKALGRQEPRPPVRAGVVNAAAAELERLARATVAAPLAAYDSAGGTVVGDASPADKYIRLIAHVGGGRYTWREVYPDAGGAWADGPGAGDSSDPAYEYNGESGLAGLRVRARRAGGNLRFQLSLCP